MSETPRHEQNLKDTAEIRSQFLVTQDLVTGKKTYRFNSNLQTQFTDAIKAEYEELAMTFEHPLTLESPLDEETLNALVLGVLQSRTKPSE